MKKDSSTECWGQKEITEEWIKLAQTSILRIHFIMPFTFQQLGDVAGKAILDIYETVVICMSRFPQMNKRL